MTLASWAAWSLVATTLLTTFLAGVQGLGLTRISLPFLLGTLLTPDRDRARAAGVGLHLVAGWLFALGYRLVFTAWGGAGAWRGALLGGLHAAFVLAVLMPAFPGLHPRMAREHHGPGRRRQLEPPGFLALHYGHRTPIAVFIAHLAYGAVLGAAWRPG